MSKQKLIDTIRAVPISGKTYEEYVEAVADRLLAEGMPPGYVRYEAKALPATLNVKYTAVGMKERGTFVTKSQLDKVYAAGVKAANDGDIHGYWEEENRLRRSAKFLCSICGGLAYFPQPTRDESWQKCCPYRYCPNCGARMMEEI